MGHTENKIENNTKPLVSVIIPNHGMDLTSLIWSVRHSSYRSIELIIVDENKERSIQRNIGIEKAKGEYLLFLDSDHIVSYGLIEECVGLINTVNAIYIPEIIATDGLFAMVRHWERSFYNGTPVDAVRFVKKDCPLFDETMSGPEDYDFDRRIKGRKVICQNPLYHYDNVSMVKFFKKKAYYTKSMKRFAEKYPNDKILDWKWRCFGVFFEKGKWKGFLSNPFMALAVMVSIGIRGVIYLQGRK